MRRWLLAVMASVSLLAACGQAPTANAPTSAPTAVPAAPAAANTTQIDLSGVKNYLIEKSTGLKQQTGALKQASDSYYALAKSANFDYAVLLRDQQPQAVQALEAARAAWTIASPLYEQMEGIVAGTPSLEQYDVILDAGGAASEGSDNLVPFDLTLPDGRVLPKPGNLFGVTESTLWGTFPAYAVPNQTIALGNTATPIALPDANVLKGGADALDRYASELLTSAQAWQPTESEAFGALVKNVPTIGDFFEVWKTSPFVDNGPNAPQRRDFVAISRLSDMVGNVSSWQIMYQGISPKVRAVDATQDAQIHQELTNLRTFIADLYTQEQGGKRFKAEEADLLSAEAQNRATAITGQISQVAAKLNVAIEQ